jgi:hypothetical protein
VKCYRWTYLTTPYIPFHGRGNSIGRNRIQAVKPSYVPAAAAMIMKKLLMKWPLRDRGRVTFQRQWV